MAKVLDVTTVVTRIWAGEPPRKVLCSANRAQVEIVRKELARTRQEQEDDFDAFIEDKWGQGG